MVLKDGIITVTIKVFKYFTFLCDNLCKWQTQFDQIMLLWNRLILVFKSYNISTWVQMNRTKYDRWDNGSTCSVITQWSPGEWITIVSPNRRKAVMAESINWVSWQNDPSVFTVRLNICHRWMMNTKLKM